MAHANLRWLVLSAGLVAAVALALGAGVVRSELPARAGTDGARYRSASAAGASADLPVLPAPAPLRFGPGIAPSDEQAVLDAVAGARPQARRLVELVAGLVTVRLGAPGAGIAGRTRTTPGGYDVELDLGNVYRQSGLRGIRRLVLHELAHVIDDALVPTALERELDLATPRGFGCDDGGVSGACAVRAERFAESFAKWATGDIGVDVQLGYRVPPPLSLQRWGDPLAVLTR